MSAGIEHNAHQVAAKYQTVADAIRAEVTRELQGLVHRVAARMRVAAPKFRTTLANSVRVEQKGPLDFMVAPHVDYAVPVERGRRPGKGLPWFDSAEAAPIVAWLQAHPAQRSDLAVRQRYIAFAAKVKRKGLAPSPFVRPVADEFRPLVPQALLAAVRRGAQAFATGGQS